VLPMPRAFLSGNRRGFGLPVSREPAYAAKRSLEGEA
jgi:hypothetical protein